MGIIATITFREFLEISLIVGIILAATRGISGRFAAVGLGLLGGLIGSIALAFFTDQISDMIDGMGQEVFNAGLMFLTAGFLSWTVIWMRRYGAKIAKELRDVAGKVRSGDKNLYVISGVICLASLREGTEIVLFTYGMASEISLPIIFFGGILGAAAGSLVGAGLYLGLLKTAQKHLFSITSWLLILLTAGIAAKGVSFLIAAGIAPPLGTQLWDTSTLIPAQSLLGEILNIIIGYTPRPTGTELLTYLLTLTTLSHLYHRAGKPLGGKPQ